MRILGIDYGSVRMGIAMGDTETRVASPLMVIEAKNRSSAIQQLLELVVDEKIDRIVVGVPRPLADQQRETAQTKTIRRFIQELQAQGLKVEETNETLSSHQAMHYVHELGQNKKRDDLAAVIILQTWLDTDRPS